MHIIRFAGQGPSVPAQSATMPTNSPVVRTTSPSANAQVEQQLDSPPATPVREPMPDVYRVYDETPPRRGHWDLHSPTTTEQLGSRNSTPIRPGQTGPSPVYRHRRGSASTTTTERWAQVDEWQREWEDGLETPVREQTGFSGMFQRLRNRLRGTDASQLEESPFRSPLRTPTDDSQVNRAPRQIRDGVSRRLFTSPERQEYIHWGYRVAPFSIVPLALLMLAQMFNSSQE